MEESGFYSLDGAKVVAVEIIKVLRPKGVARIGTDAQLASKLENIEKSSLERK